MLMGRQPAEGDLVGGLIFLAACNTAAYGLFVYSLLLVLSVLRGARPGYDAPPPPPPPERLGRAEG